MVLGIVIPYTACRCSALILNEVVTWIAKDSVMQCSLSTKLCPCCCLTYLRACWCRRMILYSKIIKLTAPVISLRTACKLKHTQLAAIIHTQWSLGQITYFTLNLLYNKDKNCGHQGAWASRNDSCHRFPSLHTFIYKTLHGLQWATKRCFG